MHWEVITNERSSLKEYRLIDQNDCKVIIKYNPRQQSVRISSGNHHRLFFLESAGSLSGKTVFRNEYGLEVGNLVHDKFHPSEGSLLLETKKFQYLLQNNATPELTIFENSRQQTIATCKLPVSNTVVQNHLSTSTRIIDNNCYLLGLCWYLFLPQVKETVMKFAAAGF